MSPIPQIITPPQPNYHPEIPFADDCLDRKHCAEVLSSFIDNSTSGIVIGISAPWGGGKTHFVTNWAALLNQRQHRAIYINAWEREAADAPLISILASLEDETATDSEQTHFDNLKRSVTRHGSKLLRIGGKAAVDWATNSTLRQAAAEEYGPDADINDPIARAIQQERATLDAVKDFQDKLSEFASNISGDGKTVIFIDELDRCRPSYTIAYLEAIKHLLSVHGIIFVLSIDKNQIFNTISAMFGYQADGGNYLRRFIDFDFSLPRPSIHAFCKKIANGYGFHDNRDNTFGERASSAVELTLPDLAEAFGFSLRQTEQCGTRIYTTYTMSNQPKWFYITDTLVFLACLMEYDRTLYDQLIHSDAPFDLLDQWCTHSPFNEIASSRYSGRALGHAAAVLRQWDREEQYPERIPESNLGRHYRVADGFRGAVGHHDFEGKLFDYRSLFRQMLELTSA